MPPIIVLDFDGTLTETDVGRALCERYADPSWEKPIRRWLRGEISFPEAQKIVWGTIAPRRDELLSYAHEVGRLRAGAEQLFEAAQKGQVELVLASGGFDLYIEPLLGARLTCFRELFYNRLRITEQGISPLFPYADLACKECGVCKGKVIARYAKAEQRVLFCGDGSSDRCALSVQSELFAVRGSDFDRHCAIHGVTYTSFDDFRTVLTEALR
jgi:2,3-diketo-5-methylthio-1-phosphopentane phosphatase